MIFRLWYLIEHLCGVYMLHKPVLVLAISCCLLVLYRIWMRLFCLIVVKVVWLLE